MSLSKANILSAVDSTLTEVSVPEWGGSIFIKVMNGLERNAWEAMDREDRIKNFRAKFLVRCLTDSEGNRLFNDEDADSLGLKSWVVLDRLFDAAFKANALGVDDLEDAKKN